jgi:hypothetical protein
MRNRIWKRGLEDLQEHIVRLLIPVGAYLIFWGMRWIGMERWFVSTLEIIDELGFIAIFACFIASLVRKGAVSAIVKDSK